MAYSDFDLETVQERFNLTFVEDVNLFHEVAEIEPSAGLKFIMDEWAPLAVAMATEKARSEMIIAPILMEAVRQPGHQVNLFSGMAFDVDRERGLNGVCDFLITRSSERFFVRKPVVAIVEAKKEDMAEGLGRCIAALFAAYLFNGKGEASNLGPVHGAVTTGNNWRFVKLDGSTVSIDKSEYFLPQVAKILGILIHVAGGPTLKEPPRTP